MTAFGVLEKHREMGSHIPVTQMFNMDASFLTSPQYTGSRQGYGGIRGERLQFFGRPGGYAAYSSLNFKKQTGVCDVMTPFLSFC